jgi:2-polyprenyl-6-methoxyphenol hydroxylase-like FAD-dependent oxidoreductase
MRIAVSGGGPGGLYSAILFRRLGHEVTVWERNAADDTFGFGVVFSDETLGAFEAADPPTYAEITRSFARWADIDIHYRGTLRSSGGHGFSALSRRRLLNILQERASELGAELHFLAEAPPAAELAAGHDLVIGADGINSRVRSDHAAAFLPRLDRRRSKFMWLGTDLVFEAFTFHIVETDSGVFQIHGYPYDETMSTFIVETDEATWRRSGLDRSEALDLPPGQSDEASIDFCREQFAPILRGHRLVANNSKWLNFHTVHNGHWHDGNVVLLGDAAHTAHFSIGSGTKLAMEDAIALAWAFKDRPGAGDVSGVLQAYEEERRPVVESTQRAAQASLEWFEDIARYVGQGPGRVRLQPAHPEPAHHLRQPAAARPGVHGGRRPGLRGPHAARRRRAGAAPDVLPPAAARARAAQPRRRLPHGHVHRRGRRGRGLPPRAPRLARRRRRRARHDGDALRVGRGTDHAGVRRPVPRRPRPGVGAHRRLRPPARTGPDRRPDRPQRPQGRHEADVGGHGPPAG